MTRNNPSDGKRPETYWTAVADLVSLIQRTRTLEMKGPVAADAEEAENVVVLDDVTPAAATAAIDNCNLRLREALHFLLEARSAEKQRLRASC